MVCAKVDKILAAMAKSCMSPKEIAEAAGVDVNHVYRMRKGYLIKAEKFGKICKVLGVDAEECIDFERLRQREGGKT